MIRKWSSKAMLKDSKNRENFLIALLHKVTSEYKSLLELYKAIIKKIKPYKKSHILISFPPEKFSELQTILSELEKLEFLEIEQASN